MDDLQRAHNDWLDPDSPIVGRRVEVSDEWREDRRMDERMESMSVEDGGPAFPQSDQHCSDSAYPAGGLEPGMSLRDYFAAKAMNGFLSHDNLDIAKTTWEGLAEDAFALADAMLAERKKANP